jgi:fimbrial chaperone protein
MIMNKPYCGSWLPSLLLLLLSTTADANLLVTPKRLVLDDATSRSELRVLNQSDKAVSYRIDWRQLRMDQSGALKEVDGGSGGVDQLVRVAPSRFRLDPGERQSIRIRFRPPPGMPTGEYMSHLTLRPQAEAAADRGDSGGKGSSFQLDVKLAISIPVVVRHGQLSSGAKIRPLGFNRTSSTLSLELERLGGASLHGTIEVYWGQANETGEQVASLGSVAVYANLERRRLDLPLRRKAGGPIGRGLLHIRYLDSDSGELLTSHTLRLE